VKQEQQVSLLSKLQTKFIKMKVDLKHSTKGNIKEGVFKNVCFRIDAALLRQAVYATLRLGIYFNLSEYIKNEKNQGKNLSAF